MKNIILIVTVFGLNYVNANYLVKNAEQFYNNTVQALKMFINESIKLEENNRSLIGALDKKHLKILEKKFFHKLSRSLNPIPKDKRKSLTLNLPNEIEKEISSWLKRNKMFEQKLRLISKLLLRGSLDSLIATVENATKALTSGKIVIYKDFLELFRDKILESKSTTEIPERWGASSAQHNIYVIYTRIILPTQLRYVTLCNMVRILREKYQNGSMTECNYDSRDILDIATKIQKIMARQSREFSKYYPLHFNLTKLGGSYTSLAPVFQYYILPGYNHVFQREDPKKIKRDVSWHSLYIARSLNNPRCSSELRDCHQPPDDMFVCKSDAPEEHRYGPAIFRKKLKGRRYACPVLDFRNEELPCAREKGFTLHGVVKVTRDECFAYEVCTCQDLASDIDRHFSLRSVTSDVGNNRVVTGVRFKKVQYVVHIQIQHGQIMKNGVVDEKSLEWKPVDSFSPVDYNVEEGQDFHTVSYDKNYICTGEIIAEDPKESYSALTGLKFVPYEDAGLTAIELQAQITPYSKRHGLLESNKSEWISYGPFPGDKNEKRRFLQNSEVFEDGKVESSCCVPFVLSKYDFDQSQSIVPQIDVRHVAPYPPIPLVGVGIFHNKERHDKFEIHGGRFSLKVYTPDLLKRKHFL